MHMMKYNRIYWLLRVKKIGIWNTLRVVFNERIFDFLNKTKTFGREDTDGVGYRYECCLPHHTDSVLTAVCDNITHTHKDISDYCFVDLGCGRGFPMMRSYDYGFRKICGIEYSKEVVDDAKHNIKIFKKRRGIVDDIFSLYNFSVEDYLVVDKKVVLFVFNSFPLSVLASFIKNLCNKLSEMDSVYFIGINIEDDSRKLVDDTFPNFIFEGRDQFGIYVPGTILIKHWENKNGQYSSEVC